MIDEQEFLLPKTLSAMVHQGIVIREQGVKVIAQGEKIREVQALIKKYPLPNGELTEAKNWYKVRGTAVITDGKEERIEEIHWYQCENIGKIEYKLKIPNIIYEAEKIHDELGDGYAIFDEGEDWYIYGVNYVKENFEEVEETPENLRLAVQ